MVANLLRAVQEHREPEKVIISAPVYIDRGTGEAGRIYRYEGWRRRRLDPLPTGEIAAPTVVITSGNLLNAGHFQALGGFDESLFIDYVDHDFCLRAVIAGFHIVVSADASLSHSVGEAISREFLGFRILPYEPFPGAAVHDCKDRWRLSGRYRRDFPAYAICTSFDFFYEFMGILFCEDKKLTKMKMILRGVFSYWNPKSAQFHRLK